MQSPSRAVKPRGVIDALAVAHGAQARATSQVRDNDAAVRDLGRDLRQGAGDVLVREAVKAVALHAGVAKFLRKRNEVGERGLRPVEAGVETGDLRDGGQALGYCFDGREIVRLMERRERNQTVQLFENLRCDQSRTAEARAAMHDAMSDGQDAGAAVHRAKPRREGVETVSLILHIVEFQIGERARFDHPGRTAAARPNAGDLAAGGQPPVFGVGPDDKHRTSSWTSRR